MSAVLRLERPDGRTRLVSYADIAGTLDAWRGTLQGNGIMSDRKLVTLDSGQFNALSHFLDGVSSRLGPADAQYSLHQVLTHLETTLNRIANGTGGGGDNSQVLNAINNLDRKVDEFMSELSDAVGSIKDDVTRIGDGVKKVLDLLTQPNPDVTNAVAALKEADAGLDAAADAMDAVINPPAQG